MKKTALIFAFVANLLFANDEICSKPEVKRMVEAVNLQAPFRVDSITTLYTSVCIDGKIVYFYALNDFKDVKFNSLSKEQFEAFKESQTKHLKNQYCTNPELIALHNILRGLAWHYSTQNGKFLHRIEILNSDCKEEKIKTE